MQNRFCKPARNAIEITFESPFSYCKQMENDQTPAKWIKGRAWVRKEPCSFGWDWGPDLPSCGIWKNITLETFNDGRIADVLILQHLDGKHEATLDVTMDVELVGDVTDFQAVLTVFNNGKITTKKTVGLSNGQGRGQLVIHNPKLWWPAGMGEQPLIRSACGITEFGWQNRGYQQQTRRFANVESGSATGRHAAAF